MIEIRNLRKRLRRRWVLNGINLTVHDGESLVILGQSGTGKSVLLKHIIGLMKPDEGEVVIDGKVVGQLSGDELQALRRCIGYVFQGAALFDSLSVGENIALALEQQRGRMTPAEQEQKVRSTLALVGLKGVENQRPSDLSGGMRKRVGLARALAQEPSYILYDEPTTGLDPVMSDSINHLIRKLQHEQKVTSVTVTHDMRSAFFVGDRLAMLHQGRIIFAGTPQEIRNSGNPIVHQFVEGESEGPIQVM